MSDIDTRLDRLESQLEQQQEIIETQQATIDRQREQIADLDGDSPDGEYADESDSLSLVTRRGALTAGGLLALLVGGVGTASADAQGQVGTEEDPLETLYTNSINAGDAGRLTVGDDLDIDGNVLYAQEINGDVTGETTVTNLTGNGLRVNQGSLAIVDDLNSNVASTFEESDVSVSTSGDATVSDGAITVVTEPTTVSRDGDDGTSGTNKKAGIRFVPKFDLSEITVTVSDNTSGESTVYVTDTSYKSLASASSPGAGNSVTLDVNLTAGTDYFAVVDNDGEAYDLGERYDEDDGLYPVTAEALEITAGVIEGTSTDGQFHAYGIKSLTASFGTGSATVKWDEPSSVSRWGNVAFDAERNGGELDIYAQTSDDGGSNWNDWVFDGDDSGPSIKKTPQPLAPGTDLSSISSDERVRFRAELTGTPSNKPELFYLIRQWRP